MFLSQTFRFGKLNQRVDNHQSRVTFSGVFVCVEQQILCLQLPQRIGLCLRQPLGERQQLLALIFRRTKQDPYTESLNHEGVRHIVKTDKRVEHGDCARRVAYPKPIPSQSGAAPDVLDCILAAVIVMDFWQK